MSILGYVILIIIILGLIGIIVWLWLKLKKYPISSFTFSPSTASVGTVITFKNTSINATKYIWNFGDGLGQETSVNPTHVYQYSGTFQIQLIASNGDIHSVSTQNIVIS